jgi:hypothetical protein
MALALLKTEKENYQMESLSEYICGECNSDRIAWDAICDENGEIICIYDHHECLDCEGENTAIKTEKENDQMTLENKIEKALIDCRNRSKDNADLIAAATMQVGQDTFEDCGISDHKRAVYLVAQYLYENAPQLDHNSIQ